MKYMPIAALVMIILGAGAVYSAPMTPLERQRLVAHLEMTGSWLADEVSALSPAQLAFRPAPESWNILEVVEHLVVAEPIYWKDLRRALEKPPMQLNRHIADDGILWYGIDRTQRQNAIPAELPKRQLRDIRAGLNAFLKLRAQMLQYARETKDDLRNHIVERERSDAYQWLLLISTHAQRHILQIREIKADPKFPKK